MLDSCRAGLGVLCCLVKGERSCSLALSLSVSRSRSRFLDSLVFLARLSFIMLKSKEKKKTECARGSVTNHTLFARKLIFIDIYLSYSLLLFSLLLSSCEFIYSFVRSFICIRALIN